MKKIALIVNPCSGGNRPRKNLSLVLRTFDNQGIEPKIFISRHKTHTHSLAGQIDSASYEAIAEGRRKIMGEAPGSIKVIPGQLRYLS